MKKIVFWSITLIITFFLGLGAFVLYYFRDIPEIKKPELLPVQEKINCVESKSFPGLSKKISEIKKGKSGYFPKDTFAVGWENADVFMNDWYGKHLKAMSEKSLLNISDENAEVYRFLWLRTFHHPIFVRVERKHGETKLFTKEFDGAGGYEPGKVFRQFQRPLSEKEWCKFLSLVEKADYWKIQSKIEDLGVDGSQWILEGVKYNHYQVVDRFSPQTGEYRTACIYLLKLSGTETDKLKDDLY